MKEQTDYTVKESTRPTTTNSDYTRNLPTNDEGETFAGELLADIDRLNLIRSGEDAGIAAELANNPWLTRELIIQGLQRSEQILLDAGAVFTS